MADRKKTYQKITSKKALRMLGAKKCVYKQETAHKNFNFTPYKVRAKGLWMKPTIGVRADGMARVWKHVDMPMSKLLASKWYKEFKK